MSDSLAEVVPDTPPTKGVRLGGRPKGTPNRATKEIKWAIREQTRNGAELVEFLLGLMRDEDRRDEVRYKAAELLLAYGHGRPSQSVSVDMQVQTRPFHTMTNEELAAHADRIAAQIRNQQLALPAAEEPAALDAEVVETTVEPTDDQHS